MLSKTEKEWLDAKVIHSKHKEWGEGTVLSLSPSIDYFWVLFPHGWEECFFSELTKVEESYYNRNNIELGEQDTLL